MITCTKCFSDVPFAHRQPSHPGHCRNIHGHNWAFEFEFRASKPDECGFVVDFGGHAMSAVKSWVAQFDHALVLNRDDVLAKEASTIWDVAGDNRFLVPDCSCEGLAVLAGDAADQIMDKATGGRVRVIRCTVYEDSKNSATWYSKWYMDGGAQ